MEYSARGAIPVPGTTSILSYEADRSIHMEPKTKENDIGTCMLFYGNGCILGGCLHERA